MALTLALFSEQLTMHKRPSYLIHRQEMDRHLDFSWTSLRDSHQIVSFQEIDRHLDRLGTTELRETRLSRHATRERQNIECKALAT